MNMHKAGGMVWKELNLILSSWPISFTHASKGSWSTAATSPQAFAQLPLFCLRPSSTWRSTTICLAPCMLDRCFRKDTRMPSSTTLWWRRAFVSMGSLTQVLFMSSTGLANWSRLMIKRGAEMLSEAPNFKAGQYWIDNMKYMINNCIGLDVVENKDLK